MEETANFPAIFASSNLNRNVRLDRILCDSELFFNTLGGAVGDFIMAAVYHGETTDAPLIIV